MKPTSTEQTWDEVDLRYLLCPEGERAPPDKRRDYLPVPVSGKLLKRITAEETGSRLLRLANGLERHVKDERYDSLSWLSFQPRRSDHLDTPDERLCCHRVSERYEPTGLVEFGIAACMLGWATVLVPGHGLSLIRVGKGVPAVVSTHYSYPSSLDLPRPTGLTAAMLTFGITAQEAGDLFYTGRTQYVSVSAAAKALRKLANRYARKVMQQMNPEHIITDEEWAEVIGDE